MGEWITITLRREIYEILKKMSEIEHRNISNMAQECVLYYLSKKHKDLKIVS